ncbi:GspE/PulE family protein [Emcibacter nanhaiensis]|uniref:GspE/PulE family protein n=1 Tax=Emcibacter nanhaiensis TaxID=1505037 RepID=UPI001C613D78|nr:GspE/PulE family protein [Emcibacter nanhaiensis]
MGDQFETYLLENGVLSPQALERARKGTTQSGDGLGDVLTRLGLLSESDLVQAYGDVLSLERIDKSSFPGEKIPLEEVSERFLLAQRALPLSTDDKELRLAVADPLEEFTREALEYAIHKKVTYLIAPASEIDLALEELYGDGPAATMEGAGLMEEVDDDIDRLRDLASEAPVIRYVNRLLHQAVSEEASDIHVEPMEASLKIRLRKDGMLEDVENPPHQFRSAITSRLKIMAGLDIAERRLPQDGRIRIAVQGRDIDFRVSTTPTAFGESVVLRILNQHKLELDFTTLGFPEPELGRFRAALDKPHGIILVTGPTGSGKTTTLYAALNVLNRPDRKILTVEDPIEYMLEGVNQVQVNSRIGLGFSSALRSFLRQDPDIMMVGEIRDMETAQIAVQASLTGHLILSTLHTNTAAGAISRLLDMGMEDFLLASTLNLVMGQRLVRKLCGSCKEEVVVEGNKSWRAVGCPSCHQSGYQGRTMIVEVLPISDRIQDLIRSKATTSEIEAQAVAEGMRTMDAQGRELVARGVTSLEELYRVVGEGNNAEI